MRKKVFGIKHFALICCALAVTLVTCIAAAANNDISAKDQSANGTLSKKDSAQYLNTTYTTEKQLEVIQQYANSSTPIAESSSSAIAEQYTNRFEKYKDYGLTYDQATDNLYFNDKLVRYFEDWYPVGDGGSAGIDYFNENGTIDVHGVRDLSQLIHNTDGSYDPSGKLIGVEPYSQAEFDTRDIEKLKNPAQAITSVAVDNSTQDNSYPYPYAASNFQLAEESKEAFKVYAEFGLTYDDDNVFRYNGKTVRRFYDEHGTLAFTREVANDYDKSTDITAVRDSNGKLTGLSVASKEEFDQRTEKIEQSRKEWEEFLKSNPNVTSYSAAQADGAYTPNAVANNATETESYNNPTVTGITSDTAYAGSYSNSDYADTSLNAYLDYGVSYDKTSTKWLFNGKPIDFLIDTGHQVYVNFSADNTNSNFAETVKNSNGVYLRVTRKSNGEIDKIIEMTVDEAVKAINAVFN